MNDDARDAARWRWFRGMLGTTDRDAQDRAIAYLAAHCPEPTTPEEVDAAIDAVMVACPIPE